MLKSMIHWGFAIAIATPPALADSSSQVPADSKLVPIGYSFVDDVANRQRNFFSIHPEVPLVGIKYRFDYEPSFGGSNDRWWDMRKDYTENIYGLLISSAIQKMEQDRSSFYFAGSGNPNKRFYSFLLSSLVIPHHESRLLHFRIAPPEYCTEYRNTSAWIHRAVKEAAESGREQRAKAFEELIPFMEDNYYAAESYFFPECKALRYQKQVNQLQISRSHDVGLMQINLTAHPSMRHADALFNLYRHINYMMDEWYSVFNQLDEKMDKVYIGEWVSVNGRSVKRYREATEEEADAPNADVCHFKTIPYTVDNNIDNRQRMKPNTIHNLALTLWSGKHNQGNITDNAICRSFRDSRDDRMFLAETLYPLLGIQDFKIYSEKDNAYFTYSSMFDTYLEKKSIEHRSLEEIRNNIKAFYRVPGVEYKTPRYLYQVADKYRPQFNENAVNYDELQLSQFGQSGEYLVNGDRVELFSKPGASAGSPEHCATIRRAKNQRLFLNKSQDVEVVENIGNIGIPLAVVEKWMSLDIPSLPHFKIERRKNTDESCNQSQLWALAQIGSDKLLERVQTESLVSSNQIDAGSFEVRVLDTKEQYFVGLNDRISGSLYIREVPEVGQVPRVGRLYKPEDPVVRVVAKYNSLMDKTYSSWVKIELPPTPDGTTSGVQYGFVPEEFLERRPAPQGRVE